jgi:NAD(P)-dependent dehydrogenase (short-subunit alcohol dehydrogenase family)
MGQLDGRKVVIIGGSSGMGLATADLSLREGAEVAISGLPDDRLDSALDSLQSVAPGRVTAQGVRVEDRTHVERFLAGHAPFDHLLLPGSTLFPQEFDAIEEQVAVAGFDSKFWGPVWAAYSGRHHIRSGGSIVFWSGPAAFPPRRYPVGYALDNAVNAMARVFAKNLGPRGIRANVIGPGPIDTPLFDAVHTPSDKESVRRETEKTVPLRRMGTAQEIAHAALFLMTNTYVTGVHLRVDGGRSLTAELQ